MSIYLTESEITLTATIANGSTTSGALDLGRRTLLGIQLPDAFTGTAISFEGSSDGTTFGPIYDEAGDAVSVPVAASRCVSLQPYWFAPWSFVKLVSDGTEAAERPIKCMTVPI